MPQLPETQSNSLRQKPILIAQGPHGGAPVEGSPTEHTTTTEGHAEHEATPGEIPNATLLFANAVLVAVVLLAFALAVRRKLEAVPRGLQNFAESLVEFINSNFTVGIIGPGGERYTPLVGTLFVFILVSNLIGQIPGFHSPTSNLSITFALGLIVFVYVQIEGMRANGVGGHLKHFMGPMPALAPLMFPIELISEIVKPFTLAIRLFGNIFGEDVIIVVLASLGAASAATSWIPFHFIIPVGLLAVLTALVQAMVFSILTCIYLSLVTHHDHGDDGHGVDTAHGHAAHH